MAKITEFSIRNIMQQQGRTIGITFKSDYFCYASDNMYSPSCWMKKVTGIGGVRERIRIKPFTAIPDGDLKQVCCKMKRTGYCEIVPLSVAMFDGVYKSLLHGQLQLIYKRKCVSFSLGNRLNKIIQHIILRIPAGELNFKTFHVMGTASMLINECIKLQ